MQKLKLEVESLRVDSFDASAEDGDSRGTVNGNSYETFYCTDPSSVGPNYCRPYPWSWNSCPAV